MCVCEREISDGYIDIQIDRETKRQREKGKERERGECETTDADADASGSGAPFNANVIGGNITDFDAPSASAVVAAVAVAFDANLGYDGV